MKKPNAETVVIASLVASTIGTIILNFKSEKEHLEELKEKNQTIDTALKQTEEAIEGWKDSRRELKVKNVIEKSRAAETIKCVRKAKEALGAPGINTEECINVANSWLDTIEVLAKNAMK